MTQNTGILICGHNNSNQVAAVELELLTGQLMQQFPDFGVKLALFNSTVSPVKAGLGAFRDDGVENIVCIPGMLSTEPSIKDALLNEIDAFAQSHPGMNIRVGRELTIDAKLLRAAQSIIEKSEVSASGTIARKDTLLMVVGSGSHDLEVNSNVDKMARMIWEGMGFGWAEVSFSETASPLVTQSLRMAAKLKYPRIILFPYFLFADSSVDRIYEWADAHQAANPGTEVIKSGCLNMSADLVACFADRVKEVMGGETNMNCQLCSYREQIIGIKTKADEMLDKNHGHSHGHSHHHHHEPGDGPKNSEA